MSKVRIALLAIAASLAISSPAAAQVACQNTDITVPGGSVIDCSGFALGNLTNGAPANNAQLTSLLLELGFVYTGDSNGIEQVFSNSNPLINFTTLLTGNTIIGVHYGNGTGSPGRPAGSAGNGDGDDTAFYLLNAGAGVDTFTLNFNSSSTVTLFQTGVTSVPEPASWAMMLMGFGAIGVSLRRRRRGNTLLQAA